MKNVEITETVTLTSDLSGKEATAERVLVVDGQGVHLDLTDKEAEIFDKAMSRYLEKGQPVKRGSGVSKDKTASLIREWANGNGFEVGARGRISAEVREAYAAAHNGQPATADAA